MKRETSAQWLENARAAVANYRAWKRQKRVFPHDSADYEARAQSAIARARWSRMHADWCKEWEAA